MNDSSPKRETDYNCPKTESPAGEDINSGVTFIRIIAVMERHVIHSRSIKKVEFAIHYCHHLLAESFQHWRRPYTCHLCSISSFKYYIARYPMPQILGYSYSSKLASAHELTC